jgi:flavorubredoxin
MSVFSKFGKQTLKYSDEQFAFMKKILILYYSRTGNTEKMANAVAEGAKSNDFEIEMSFHVDAGDLNSFDAIIVGAPTYHHDMPVDFKNLFEEASVKGVELKGKVGGAFGSYGWSGEAPKLILEILKNKFGMEIVQPPLIARYIPDQVALNSCKELGQKISETLMNKI